LNIGGMQTQMLSLIENLNKEKYEIVVCCIYDGILADELKTAGIRVFTLNKEGGIFDLKVMRKLCQLMKKEPVAIVHCHGYTAGLRGQSAAYLTKVPVIIKSYHGLNLWKKGHFLLLEWLSGMFTDKFIVVSDVRKELLTKREKIKPEKVVTVYNGINYKKYDVQIDINQKKLELGLESRKPVVAVVATLEKIKDHRTFLSAAQIILKESLDTQFLIVGDGTLRKHLEDYCTQLGIQKYIRFIGSRRDIPEILSIVDIVVLSSLREDLPMSLLEAMSARKPVVATKVGGCSEVVVDGETGYLVEPGNPNDLAANVLRILRDGELAYSMGRKGRARVEKIFNARDNAEKIEGIYDHFIKTKLLHLH
jgi:glycosyltransferase involved in cell wall biosynthesis